MHTKTGTARLLADECSVLVGLLDVEERHYRRLLRLAWRQNSYMKRQDVDRLESNAREWARYLPVANESRIARERFVTGVSDRLGIKIPPQPVRDLLAFTDEKTRWQVERALRRLRNTAERLARQNALNRDLAAFCLDLAREESAIFQRSLRDDPQGCYGDDARNTGRSPGGVLVRQA